MALTELQCGKAKPTGKDYQLADDRGLSLVVRAKGVKLWDMSTVSTGRKPNVAKLPASTAQYLPSAKARSKKFIFIKSMRFDKSRDDSLNVLLSLRLQ